MNLVFYSRNKDEDYKRQHWILKLEQLPRTGDTFVIEGEIMLVDGVTHDLDNKQIKIFLTNE